MIENFVWKYYMDTFTDYINKCGIIYLSDFASGELDYLFEGTSKYQNVSIDWKQIMEKFIWHLFRAQLSHNGGAYSTNKAMCQVSIDKQSNQELFGFGLLIGHILYIYIYIYIARGLWNLLYRRIFLSLKWARINVYEIV